MRSTFQHHLRPFGPHRFIVAEPYWFEWKKNGVRYRFNIPRGFRYDAASIPRFLWPIISPTELGYLAPAVHDFLIEQQGYVYLQQWSTYFGQWRPVEARFTRRQADRLFCRIMRNEGISRWKRRAAFRAVRLYGWAKRKLTGKEW